MRWYRDWTAVNLTMLAGLVLSTGVTGLVCAEFIQLAPLPESGARASMPEAPHSRPAGNLGTRAILRAVAANPMRPDRRRPVGRFGQANHIAEREETPPPPPVPDFRLAGVAERPSGADLAAIAVSGAPARLVRRGETIEGFELRRVRADFVLLARSDTILRLTVPGRSYARAFD